MKTQKIYSQEELNLYYIIKLATVNLIIFITNQ